MPVMDIILDGDNCWPELLEREADIIHLQERIAVAALPGGMASGKPSVTLRLDLPDGRVVLAETSLALFLSAADAFRARYGDPRVE